MERNLVTELDEQRLDELLNYTPRYSEQSSENIKRLFLQKATVKRNAPRKHVLSAALIAAAVMILSCVAFAATMGFDLGRIYNSFFNNPSVANKIEVGQSIEKNGLEITLLSAFTDGGKAHALLEIKDVEGKRLSDSIRVVSDSHNVYTGVAIYDDIENKTTLALTMYFNNTVAVGDRLELEIDAILSGISFIETEPLDFNIAAHAISSETVSQDEWNKTVNGGKNAPGASSYSEDSNLPFDEDGKPEISLLKPDEMEAVIGGIDWAVVTNVGVIDDRLHLQYKKTDKYNENYNNGTFYLLDGKGNAVKELFDVNSGGYEEIVFDIADIKNLNDLRLAVSGPRFDNVTLGPWDMSFVIDKETPTKSMTVVPDGSPYFAELDIKCSPIATSIKMTAIEEQFDVDGDNEPVLEYLYKVGEYFESFGIPYLTFDDGSTIVLVNNNSMFDNYGGSADYESVYFDIETLRSITICGEEYFFTETP